MKVIYKRILQFIKPKKRLDIDLSRINLDDISVPENPLFIVGTGRNGTHFFSKVLEVDDSIFSVHLDTINHSEADSFIPYVIWYNLPIDLQPFKEYRQKLIRFAANQKQLYCESNPYLSLIADKLVQWFDARIILVVRNPVDVVNSHYVKGWYERIPPRSNTLNAPCFWPELNANRFFGRLMPIGEEYDQWIQLSRIGKIAWWWDTLNNKMLELVEQLPTDRYRIIKIENFDYMAYRDLCQFIGKEYRLTQTAFDKIRRRPPGKGTAKKSASSWSPQEREDFQRMTTAGRAKLGYN